MMVEPTESESKDELDRFCDALIAIRKEIQAVMDGTADPKDNVLKNAPHTAEAVTSDTWSHPCSREQAGLSTAIRPRQQVLASGLENRQPAWRPQPDLRLPADRGA